jgi:predicted RNase H-like HicB family nuclease
VRLTIQFDREEDGRFIAEIPELPGVLAYGATQAEAASNVRALALRVIADQIEAGELSGTNLNSVSFAA